jgi:N-acetylmuramidase/Putative peptidoglycan binding domain
MPLEFSGPATPLGDADIENAATQLGCQVAAVRAVIDVESRGGFLPDQRPKILFERHYFHRLTDGRFSAGHPDISHSSWGGYGAGGAAQYDRLHRAIALNRDAALRSASWGSFQIMGDNCKMVGFTNVEDFVAAMVSGAPGHLAAFVKFVKKAALDDELRRRDWAGFARGYNGPNYKANKYDEKLAAAFAFYHAGGPHVDSPLPVLRMGDRGESVRKLQELLKIGADGDFGPGTKEAVIKFQKSKGLHADGVVGKNSWAALGA